MNNRKPSKKANVINGLSPEEPASRAQKPRANKSVLQEPYIPTDEVREHVKELVFAGLSQDRIAKILGFSENTLRRHYREELDIAMDKVMHKVSNIILKKALGGDLYACMFIMKQRGHKYGWSGEAAQLSQESAPSVIAIPSVMTSENWKNSTVNTAKVQIIDLDASDQQS